MPTQYKNEQNKKNKMSEVYKLPSWWEGQKLGELAEYVNGMDFKTNDWSNIGLQIIRIQNL
ncbi:tRNA isopentenyltransferase, partial [Francisella tularensis subsp. holarctica]|nr:tRNA isopentenyltransferase [Francisella tularensis subsp. holarctica]